MYKYYNKNVHGRFVNDCVIRAISVAECKTWDETYDELSNLAQKQGTLLDDSNFVDNYLNERYVSIYPYARTVGEFCEEYPKGTYLVTMRGHITVIIDGVLYDIFDCLDREIWDVWRVDKRCNNFIR